jgi:hypothetical protein
MSFDLYPMETLASKKRLLPELAQKEAILIFPHDPNVPWVRLVESEGKIATQPVNEGRTFATSGNWNHRGKRSL